METQALQGCTVALSLRRRPGRLASLAGHARNCYICVDKLNHYPAVWLATNSARVKCGVIRLS